MALHTKTSGADELIAGGLSWRYAARGAPGAILDAILGAAFLGPIVHILLIGVVVLGVAAAVYRGRRMVLARTRDDKRLKAS